MEINLTVIIIIGLLTINFIFSIYLFVRFTKSQELHIKLLKDVKGLDLEHILNSIQENLNKNNTALDNIKKEIDKINEESKRYFQKLGFKRYNPFHETGGDQSFVLALFDQKNTGFILTTLHQKETTRIYSKKIINGKSENKLSKEEQEVLNSLI